MHNKSIFILFLLVANHLSAQTNDVWVRYTDQKTDLSGYKDLKGNIKIPARFEGFTRADTFHNIIAVQEKIKDTYKSSYLLKNGKIVGRDSVYMFDFSYDCESEGKIKFSDDKKDRVGFFNKDGAVIIPAIYNYATSFYNGLSLTIKNAIKKCWGKDEDTLNCEHWSWSGGEICMINEENEILLSYPNTNRSPSFNFLSFYSLKINEPGVDKNIYTSIKGKDGNIYSFLNYQKEFNKWFYSVFVSSICSGNVEKMKQLLFTEVTHWIDKQGWISEGQDHFLKSFPPLIFKSRFQDIDSHLKNISISGGSLSLIKNDSIRHQFQNACREPSNERYPVFEVIKTYYKGDDKTFDYQEHLEFIRTCLGYKLFSVSLKDSKTKKTLE